MHELSLAQGLMDQLQALAAEHKAERILRLSVTIGSFSGIVVDSFTFGFDALKLDNPLTREAVLEIEVPPPLYRCLDCKQTFIQEQEEDDVGFGLPYTGFISRSCAGCGSQRLSPEGGDELILKQVEME